MSDKLFIPIKFNTTITLLPKELSDDFENTFLKKVKNNLEGMCSKHGYIKKGSIKIIKRSIGQFKKQHFNGNIIYDLNCLAEICNPAQGSIIKCKIKNKNTMGLLAEGLYDGIPILEIIIPKISAGIISEINIDEVNIGDYINIEVCGKKFMLYDKNISIIGRAIKNKEENIKNIIQDEAIENDDDDIEPNILGDNYDEDDDDNSDDEDNIISGGKVLNNNNDENISDDGVENDENLSDIDELDNLSDISDVLSVGGDDY
tara:strand:- start:201 stop:980 length:780 start_codon:yes stop_codon:yes gene_type:complete